MKTTIQRPLVLTVRLQFKRLMTPEVGGHEELVMHGPTVTPRSKVRDQSALCP